MSLGRGAAFALILAPLVAATAWLVVRGDPSLPHAPGGEGDPVPPAPVAARSDADAQSEGVTPSRADSSPPPPARTRTQGTARKRLGAGLVIGRIVDPAGRPVAGANVYLVGAAAQDPPFLRAPRDPLRHARQRAVEGESFRYRDVDTVQSRDDGSFVFVGSQVPDDDRVELHVLLATGGVPLLEPEPKVLAPSECQGSIVTVACRWGGMADLACLAPALRIGEQRVKLTLACEEGGVTESWDTSLRLEHGRARIHGLPPGRYAAWVQGAGSLAVGPFFRIDEGGPMRLVELQAGPATLVVRVLDDRGQPFRHGVDVIVAGVAANGGGAEVPFELRLAVRRNETSARFTGLPEGQVRIDVAPNGEKRIESRTAFVAGVREERFVLALPPAKPCVVQGAVQALGSLPLLATLRIHDAAAGPRPALVRECCTDAQGRFLVEGLPDKSLLVLVSAPGHQKRLVRMDPRKDRPTEVCWVLVPQAEGMAPVVADPDATWGVAGRAAESLLELFEKPERPPPPATRPKRGQRPAGAGGRQSGKAEGGGPGSDTRIILDGGQARFVIPEGAERGTRVPAAPAAREKK